MPVSVQIAVKSLEAVPGGNSPDVDLGGLVNER
jgi:hypothetical protein